MKKVLHLLAVAAITLSLPLQRAHAQIDTTGIPLDTLSSARVLFLPGILGSRLFHDETDTQIWGNLTSTDPLLFYDPEHPARAEPLDQISAFGIEFRRATYGVYLEEQFRKLSTAESFIPFSYDWRASTIASARSLERFICQEMLGDTRPTIIVAHSMGGLVFKHWLDDYYSSGCANNGEAFSIERIIFVATPHLGAPRSIDQILRGPDLLGVSVINEIVSQGLDRYGLSFDSIYELIPFTSSYEVVRGERIRCFAAHQNAHRSQGAFRHRFIFLHSATGQRETIDPYSIAVHERLGVVKRAEQMLRDTGRDYSLASSYLKAKLKQGRESACKLSRFEFPKELVDRITYFYGNMTDDNVFLAETVSEIVISDAKHPSASIVDRIPDPQFPGQYYYYYINRGPGDGTVPTEIAADPFLMSVSTPHSGDASHLDVLSSSSFREMMRRLSLASTRDVSQTIQRDAWLRLEDPTRALNDEFVLSRSLPQRMRFIEFDDQGVVEDIVIGDEFRVASISNASPGEALKAIDTRVGIWRASIWEGSILANGSAEHAYQYALNNPTAENWHVVSRIHELDDIRKISAAAFAAGGYISDGNLKEAANLYGRLDQKLGANADLAEAMDFTLRANIGAGQKYVGYYSGNDVTMIVPNIPRENGLIEFDRERFYNSLQYTASSVEILRANRFASQLGANGAAIFVDQGEVQDTLLSTLPIGSTP